MRMTWRGRHQPTRILVCVVSTATVLLIYLGGFTPLRHAELNLRDFLIRKGRTTERDERLVFLAIDNASVVLDGVSDEEKAASRALTLMSTEFPWSREVYALILDRLIQAGARVVAIDLLFPTARETDEEFAAALDRYRDRVVIGSNFVFGDRSQGSLDTYSMPSDSLIPQTSLTDDRVGVVNFVADNDGVVRRANFRIAMSDFFGFPPTPEEEVLESFSARILRKMGHPDMIPQRGNTYFRFTGAPGSREGFVPMSLYSIFVPRWWESATYGHGNFFRDKVVLIGPEGNWTHDYHATPLGLMPGPELHLNALNAAMHQEFLWETSTAQDVVLIVAGGLLAWMIGLLIEASTIRFFLLLAVTLMYFAATQFAYSRLGVYLPIITPLLPMVGGGVLWLVFEQVFERIEKLRMRRTLERYVSRNVVREILDNPRSYLNALGGERKNVTILMTDLRGFTTITEQADSTKLVAQLNEYFEQMVRCVFEHSGTVDKFIGDALLAVWGNVQSDGSANDAEKAVRAAMRMQERLAALNERWTSLGMTPFAMGIGINHGDVIFGNIGSSEKMEPTVIGDAVNVASRLEGLTKEYGVTLIVGQSVADLVGDRFQLQLVDRVQVKGKSEAINVYTVVKESPDLGGKTLETYLRSYSEGMNAYEARNFGAAMVAFQECVSILPENRLATFHLERCRAFQKRPPKEAWVGLPMVRKL